jgi:hypothetical protein
VVSVDTKHENRKTIVAPRPGETKRIREAVHFSRTKPVLFYDSVSGPALQSTVQRSVTNCTKYTNHTILYYTLNNQALAVPCIPQQRWGPRFAPTRTEQTTVYKLLLTVLLDLSA